MSVKSFDQLNEILEELSQNQEWTQVDSSVKQHLLNEIHEQIAQDLLYSQIKSRNKPKASRRSRKKAEKDDDGSKTA